MATKLQFDPDYYRIVNLEEEESKDEKYGVDAIASYKQARKDTQPKLEFPVLEGAFPDHLLANVDDNRQSYSSSSDYKEGEREGEREGEQQENLYKSSSSDHKEDDISPKHDSLS